MYFSVYLSVFAFVCLFPCFLSTSLLWTVCPCCIGRYKTLFVHWTVHLFFYSSCVSFINRSQLILPSILCSPPPPRPHFIQSNSFYSLIISHPPPLSLECCKNIWLSKRGCCIKILKETYSSMKIKPYKVKKFDIVVYLLCETMRISSLKKLLFYQHFFDHLNKLLKHFQFLQNSIFFYIVLLCPIHAVTACDTNFYSL